MTTTQPYPRAERIFLSGSEHIITNGFPWNDFARKFRHRSNLPIEFLDSAFEFRNCRINIHLFPGSVIENSQSFACRQTASFGQSFERLAAVI